MQHFGRLRCLFGLIATSGGNCLIPVFALGRAQELLLILDEYTTPIRRSCPTDGTRSHPSMIPRWYRFLRHVLVVGPKRWRAGGRTDGRVGAQMTRLSNFLTLPAQNSA
jgi:hypothetical protein